MEINDIEIDDAMESATSKHRILCFFVNKILVEEKYPDAESAEIELKLPKDSVDPDDARVRYSPIKDGKAYDWNDVDARREVIEYLIDEFNDACE